MRTGKVSKIFGVDPKTIIQWTNTFSDFFSAAARGLISTQRNYNPDDLIVINTIASYRVQGKDMAEIAMSLKAGERNANLPAEAATIGTEQAITIYAQLKQYQAELDETRKALIQKESENDKLQTEVRRLEREVGKWMGKYEELADQLYSDDDK